MALEQMLLMCFPHAMQISCQIPIWFITNWWTNTCMQLYTNEPNIPRNFIAPKLIASTHGHITTLVKTLLVTPDKWLFCSHWYISSSSGVERLRSVYFRSSINSRSSWYRITALERANKEMEFRANSFLTHA